MAENTNKTAALNNAVSQIEKQFGKGSIMKLGGKEVVQIPAISSGCIALDIITGIGGYPRGRVIEIFGPESSGKTTLALHGIAEAQKAGGYAAFIDAEHSLDPLYAQKLGVNIDELYIAQPDWGEQALEIAEILVRSGGVDIIVVDSVAALVPKAELEGDMGDSHMGLQARLMSQALRKLTAIVARSKTTFVFLNQLRQKIGMFVGNPETTSGGRALKFYASLRIEVKRIMAIKEGTDIVGGRIRIKVVKNKMAPPFKEVEVDLYYGKGFSKESDIIELGVLHGIISKTGAWYSYGDNRLGQGKESVRKLFEENRTLFEEIKGKILEKLAPALKEKEKETT
ncbi:MAG: recombinase RecA [Acidobacteria bacterium]|nr:recombinase RecA [Acidobacteriota bacterium]MBU4308117.1 recombinase RecA [Acidobacteriota bacterium]MCG2812550.1 recombinase RecA [Candidatus Aminicenantes bacterium]